jgi:hypothetical protein
MEENNGTNGTYKTQIHEIITQLQAETKAGELPREPRYIESIT